ncbi:unnamed protein product [Paramecium octaurelia]|uniref:Uncharacterized protein n=1 Tax=Paramecium octaurelia TaxID=43137 RepID=A0A8S1VNR7_PAROT|nr:unnamed protein product [Paramecium octaurelia]
MNRRMYDCGICQMRFEDITSYQNHKQNFCNGTSFNGNFNEQSTTMNLGKRQQQETNQSSTLLLNNTTEQLELNEQEYKILRSRILERENNSNINMSQMMNNSLTYDKDQLSQLQESMNSSVRVALFGQDQEREMILKELKDRTWKEREYLKDRDTIDREIKKAKDAQRIQELKQLGSDRDILFERYNNFIAQCNEILNSKSGLYKKDNLDRVIQLNKIKESIEQDRMRIMSSVFSDLMNQTGYRSNDASKYAAQQILSDNSVQGAGASEIAQHWQFPDDQKVIEYDPQQIKYDQDMIEKNLQAATRLSQEIKMHMVGMDPALKRYAEANGYGSLESIFAEKSEDYSSMTPEQKKLINLLAQETDAKRALERLPYGLDYQIMQSKVDKITQMRLELERTVQEQKYYKIRENYEQTVKDSDQERKQNIRDRLLHQMESWRGEKKYNPTEGLVIHWDWCLNVPKKYDRCRLTWGMFLRGQTLNKPQIVEDHMCISDGYRVNYCMFNEHQYVYDVIPNKDIIVVIELQCYYQEGGRKRLDIYGWTVLEVFDINMNLIRGRFKLPFYPTGTNPSQLVSSDKPLKSVSNTLLFCRISFPFDNEYSKMEPLNPSTMTQEYYITGIHSRTIIKHDYDHVPQSIRKRGYNPLAFDELFNQKREIEPEEVEVVEVKEPEWQLMELGENRRGLYINIHELLNYFVKTKSKVRCFLTDVKRGVLKDEKDIPCSFETDPYEMNEQQLKSDYFGGPFVFIEEEYQFFVDLVTYAHNNRAWDDLYLIFQVFDYPPEKVEKEDDKKDNQSVVSEQSVTDVKPVGKRWYAFKLFENNILKIGRFSEFIYEPPIKKPPFDPFECRITNSQIDFSINLFDYNMGNLNEQMEKFKQLRQLKRKQRGHGKPKIKPKKEKKEKQVAYDWQNLPLSDRPFIENLKQQYQDRPFDKGFGIDFYIDQARFLPDNVTVCKIILQFMNTNLEKLYPPKSVLPDIGASTYSPIFNYKNELRSPHFDPTTIAFLTILTKDNTQKEVRIVGYCAINLFLSKATKMQPTNPLERDVVLMNGLYQLPIHCQHPAMIKPFNMNRVQKLDRLPCSTLLVRIFLAPMSDDGFKPLSINDFSQQDWQAKKVWQLMPPYGTGLYNTQFCPIRETEKLLYNIRVQRQDPKLREIMERLLSMENIQQTMTAAQFLSWLDGALVRDAYTDLIELTYFAKYKGQVGFKVSLDGFHNVPDTDHPYVAIYSINPPGRLYLQQQNQQQQQNDINLANEIITCTSYNWESALQSPQFNEGYFKFKDIPFDKNTHLVFDIRRVKFSQRGTKSIVEKVGWTVLPIFTQNGFVKSGIYQVPVLAGEITFKIIEEFQRGEIWDQIDEMTKQKKNALKYLDNMSIIVRLLDGHREGHFQTPFDHSRMIYSYLPKNRMSSYVYNAGVDAKLKTAKKLISIAPNKQQLNEYNEKISNALYQSLGLKPQDAVAAKLVQIENPNNQTNQEDQQIL